MATAAKILLVDDERELALAVKIRLQSLGYQVAMAHDGQQGLDAALADRPDLIIMDILMPVLDGYALLRELNARMGSRRPPVIVLTARDKMQELFSLEGIDDYMLKPFDHEDLALRIQRILRRHGQSPSGA